MTDSFNSTIADVWRRKSTIDDDETLDTEILAALQIGLSVLGGFLALWFVRMKERQYLALVPQIKSEFEEIVDSRIESLKDEFGGTVDELLTPTVKKAFGALGSLGGEAKAEKGLVDEMAGDVLNSPNFSAIRAGASLLGLDMDSYISRHGAARTIQAANQIAKMLGIDIMKIDLSSLSLPGGMTQQQGGGNPYLGR